MRRTSRPFQKTLPNTPLKPLLSSPSPPGGAYRELKRFKMLKLNQKSYQLITLCIHILNKSCYDRRPHGCTPADRCPNEAPAPGPEP